MTGDPGRPESHEDVPDSDPPNYNNQLEILRCAWAPLIKCPQIDANTFSQLTSLTLYHRGLTKIPKSIRHLTRLTQLDLARNELCSLPSTLCELSCLRFVDLSNNRFSRFPEVLTRCSCVDELRLDDNRLRAIPREIGRMKSMIRLSLDNNRLRSLPTEIGELGNLLSLQLSHNRLKRLPAEINSLRQLWYFNVTYNRLTILPFFFISWMSPGFDAPVFYDVGNCWKSPNRHCFSRARLHHWLWVERKRFLILCAPFLISGKRATLCSDTNRDPFVHRFLLDVPWFIQKTIASRIQQAHDNPYQQRNKWLTKTQEASVVTSLIGASDICVG